MSILVDTSVWVDYFRGTDDAAAMDWLIEEGILATNDIILAELLPALLIRKEHKLASLLKEIERHPLEIDWDEIIQLQIICIKHGINKVGIPDLIITLHAIQHNMALFTFDKHFSMISRHTSLHLYS